MQGLTFCGDLAKLTSLLVPSSASFYALISFCMSLTVLCGSSSDFIDLGVIVPMLEQNVDAVVVPFCLFVGALAGYFHRSLCLVLSCWLIVLPPRYCAIY